jgi:single-stranded-DNA-specific exonuclease
MNYKSVTGKNWLFKQYDENYAKKIYETFHFSEILSKIISIRKIELDQIENFINPTIKKNIPNPNSIKDMGIATNAIIFHIQNKNIIGIFGDYDVDGATSTAILAKYFKHINQPFELLIPDRIKDGYGPTEKGFDLLIDKGSKLIISTDCGTSSFDAILHAKNKNVETIVLDHHQGDIKLPEATAIVNPNRIDDESKLSYLCAAGVCFMFLVALNSKLRNKNWFKLNNIIEPDILNFLDLVCLGTICDVVPVIGLNRAIVKQGLKVFGKRKNIGLKTLYDNCKIKNQPNTYHLGYLIGPKINAGGRVGKSAFGAELLISDNQEKVDYLVKELNNFNEQRKKIEFELIQKIENETKYNKDPILLIQGKDFHEGIIGIAASRIKDKYKKPCIIISVNGKIGKGSARSVFGFDIGSIIISAVQNRILIKGGGHKMAGGFSININNIETFKEFLIKKYNNLGIKNGNLKNLYLDSLILPTALNAEFYKNIEILSPFGAGNPEPKFIIEDLKLANSNIIANKHIKAIFYSKSNEIIKTIAFNSVGTVLESYLIKNNKSTMNIIGTLISNYWNKKNNIEFVINDISVNNI